MTVNARQKALAMLAELAALAPDVRLGQLMAHLGFLGEDQVERSLWDIEDDELLAVLHRHRAELIARQEQGDEKSNRCQDVQTPLSHGR